MGSVSELKIGKFPIFYMKNGYFEDVLKAIFNIQDFISEKRPNQSNLTSDTVEDDDDFFEFFGFQQTVKVCKMRLEIYGTTYKKAKSDFNAAKKSVITDNYYEFSLRSLTYDKYLQELKNIIENNIRTYENQFTNIKDYLISSDLCIGEQSTVGLLYSILSVLPENELIEYDMSEVISNGWVKIDDFKNFELEKIIILTEGKTDVEFISKSIDKFYPYLSNYYHFIDFDEYKIESNASALVKLILAFAAAKVKHPIIALFDNDTTGILEMKKLLSKELPKNIKILKYPNLNIAKKYPTIGPTGIKIMNVNELACGIEMYLGKNTLCKNNEVIPVQWKGYNEKEKKYQGEILEKQYVQETFRNTLKDATINDLPEMNLLLNEIFNAFN